MDMFFYFSTPFAAALKVNGGFCGLTEASPKSIRVKFGDFIELCPITARAPYFSFVLTEVFVKEPPDGVFITDLKGGYLITYCLKTRRSGFSIMAQNKFPDLIATALNDNGVKISIETPTDFFAEEVDPTTEKVEFFRLYDKTVLAVLHGEKKNLRIYDVGGKIEKIFSRAVDDFSVDGGLLTEERFCDVAKHVKKTRWKYEVGKMICADSEIQRDPDFLPIRLNVRILPYAFLEELAVGGDCGEYVGGTVKENFDKLKGYLGEYIGVIPPPPFVDCDKVGIVLPNGKNKYRVDYLSFTTEDRRIVNIIKE